MSSDDDEESMQIKKIECDRVHEMQKDWGVQLRVKEPFGEDAPFFSNYDWPSRSNMLFGTANEMKPDLHEEVARRVAIMVSFILESIHKWWRGIFSMRMKIEMSIYLKGTSPSRI